MFQYKEYSIAALALLLSGSVFAADFNTEEKVQIPNSTVIDPNVVKEEYDCDGYKTFFSEYINDEEREAPNRPANVDEDAFFAPNFPGLGDVWIQLRKKYTVQEWLINGTPSKMDVKPLYLPTPDAESLIQWKHIAQIWYPDGSINYSLQAWRAYCDISNPEALQENFAEFSKTWNTLTQNVTFDDEKIKTVLELYKPHFSEKGTRKVRLISQEDFINEIMGNLINN